MPATGLPAAPRLQRQWRRNGLRIGHERRNEDRQDAVDVFVSDQCREGATVMIRRRRGKHVDRIRDTCGLRKERTQFRPCALASATSSRPFASQASAARIPGPSSIRQDRHAPATRDRLVGEKRGDVEQFLERVRADHARLTEQRVDDRVGGRQGAGMGRCRSRTRAGPPRLDRHDRLHAGRHAAQSRRTSLDSRSSPDTGGSRRPGILRPVLNQVVPETSILLPTDTKLEIPMLSCRA